MPRTYFLPQANNRLVGQNKSQVTIKESKTSEMPYRKVQSRIQRDDPPFDKGWEERQHLQ